jgi:hypothetical protein
MIRKLTSGILSEERPEDRLFRFAIMLDILVSLFHDSA